MDVTIPPTIGAAIRCITSAPVPWLQSAGSRPSMIAATVISQFQETIQHTVALAVLMPIVAAMGGNAGVQVITVTVRALATRDITPQSNLLRIVGKELIVGFLNALVFAAILGVIAAWWFGHVGLGYVLAGAMIFNMVWAGMAGTLIPLAMDRLGLDPAIGAGPSTSMLDRLSLSSERSQHLPCQSSRPPTKTTP